MLGFILDMQGLEISFKIPEGVSDAVYNPSSGLMENETLSAVGESGNPGLA